MEKLKYRYFIIVLLLSATAALVSTLKYDVKQDNERDLANLQSIPMQIGNWEGMDFSLDESVYEILETKAIVHRNFVSDKGEDVFLSIVHYTDTKVDFHTPESCIGGRGLKTVKTSKSITLFSGDRQRKFNVAKLVTTRSSGRTLTYYFFKSGNFLGDNYLKMRLSIAANKLTQNDTRASLIRISTSLTLENETSSEMLLFSFLEKLYPYIINSI